MGKRVLSGLLALLMCVSLGGTVLPQTAKAEDGLDWEVLWQDDMVFFDEDPWGICCAYEDAILTTRYVGTQGDRTAILYSFDGKELVPVLEGGFPWHGQGWPRGESIISDDGYFVIYLPEYGKDVVADYKGNVVLSEFDTIASHVVSEDGWVVGVNYPNKDPEHKYELLELTAVNLVTGERIELPDNFDGHLYNDGIFTGYEEVDSWYFDAEGDYLFGKTRVGSEFSYGYAFAREQDGKSFSVGENNLVIDTEGNIVVRLDDEYFFDRDVQMTESGIFRVSYPSGHYGLAETVGYMNLKGEWIVEPGIARNGGEFHNGYLPLYTEEGFTVVDENGTFLIEPGSVEAIRDKAFSVGFASNVTDAGLLWVQLNTYEGDTVALLDLDGPENNPWYDGTDNQGNTETKPDPKPSATATPTPIPTPTPTPVPGSTVTDPPVAADPNAVAAVSDNAGDQDYRDYGHTYRSFLYQRSDGRFTRVEALKDSIAVETYSADFELLSAKTVPMELPLFGFFLAGEEYNYLLFGQNNPDETDQQEVYRVVKYSKGWERLGDCKVFGMNTREPFSFGSAWMTEFDGMLYVHSCRSMYKTGDGVNHQSNVTFRVQEQDMSLQSNSGDAHRLEDGYVSHSYRQIVLVDDDGSVVLLDHGDTYPRSLLLQRCFNNGSHAKVSYCDFAVPGHTATGGSVGGLVSTNTHYLAAYNLDNQVGDESACRNIKVGAVAKDGMRANASTTGPEYVTTLTNYSANGTTNVSTPQMVELSKDRCLILWEIQEKKDNGWGGFEYNSTGNIGYAYVDGTGRQIGSTKTTTGRLSDCQPIVVGDNVVWYVTQNSMPIFYVLGEKGLRTVRVLGNEPQFTDVEAGNWAYPFVQRAYANGAVNGVGNGKYNPGGEVTLAQFAAMLGNVAYNGEVADKAMTNWYNRQVEVLQEHGVLQGVDSSNMDAPATRYVMAQMVYNLIKDFGETLPDASALSAAQAEILDWDQIPQQYRTAVSTCYAMKIFAGVKDVGFAGDRAITRDAMAAMYCNMADVLEASVY